MLDLSFCVKALVSLFVILNPLGAIPMFLSLTQAHEADRSRTAVRSSIAVGCVLVLSAILGKALLTFFGIGVPSFRVGGGILLLIISVDMLSARVSRARTTDEENAEASERDDVAVVPLALPLISGPGTISTVILYSQGEFSGVRLPILVVLCLIMAAMTWVCLRLAIPIGKRLGQTGLNTMQRIMGLLLAAIAVEFMAAGLRELLPALAG